jgi:hypothetical protein
MGSGEFPVVDSFPSSGRMALPLGDISGTSGRWKKTQTHLRIV